MSKPCIFLLNLSALIFLVTPVTAEVQMTGEQLSVHVDNQSLSTILETLSRQGTFDVTVLEKEAAAQTSVTHHFDHLSIQEGLSRLLAQWNYGITTDQSTGHIREIFLVSKRINPNNLPTLKQSAASLRYPNAGLSHLPQDDSLMASFQEEEEIYEMDSKEVRESNDDAYLEDDEIVAKILPADLPAEIREEFLRDLAANQEVQLETR